MHSARQLLEQVRWPLCVASAPAVGHRHDLVAITPDFWSDLLAMEQLP